VRRKRPEEYGYGAEHSVFKRMAFVITTPFQPGSYERLVATCGGSPARVFSGLILELIKRYYAQLSTPPPGEAYLQSLGESLWETVIGEGLPVPLGAAEVGEPRTLEDSYLLALVEKTLARLPRHRTEDQLRAFCIQILIALLSPEFKACRQSFQRIDAAGGDTCARHSLDHCRDRISGSHCEDCPFFVALSQDQHRKLLGRSFSPSLQAVWSANTGLFLPEDFRALRIFWHLHIRQPRS
jgi:hypothetical protein